MSERSPLKLREDLVIRRREFSGEVKYVVKDPLRLDYYTVDELSYTLLNLCDGRRDLAEISELAEKLFPGMGLNALALLDFCETYRKFHFFEDAWERNILLIEKRRGSRAKALKRAVANPLEIHLPAWNPDRFFGRLTRPLAFLFTFKALVAYALIFLAALWIMVSRADEFALSFTELWIIPGRPFVGLAVLWFILLLTVVLHEVGHGLTCKFFGGGVYKIGFLLLYFNPCMFCDVTESYFFEDTKKKHAVTLAGGIVDLMTAALATFVWFFTSPDLFVNQIAHRVAIFNGVTGILVNYNPLMKYDGYLLLSDHLGVPNLRGDAFRFVGNRLRSLFGLPFEEEIISARERRIFWFFGTAAVLYSVFVLYFVVLMVGGLLVYHFRAVGYLVTAALVLLLTKRFWKNLGGFVRFFALDKAAHFRRHRRTYAFGLVALAVMFFAVPLPRHVRGGLTLLPGAETVLRARECGVIEAVLAGEGEWVRAGTAPVILRSDEMGLARGRARALATAALADRASAQTARDPGRAVMRGADLSADLALERHLTARGDRLSPAAPTDGVVLTPRLRERVGWARAPGDTLCVLAETASLRAEVVLDERDLGILDRGAPVEIRPWADPGRLVRGEIELVSPGSSAGAVRRMYRLLVRVDNSDGRLRPGMTGVARFDAGRATAFQHLMSGIARTIRIEFWI